MALIQKGKYKGKYLELRKLLKKRIKNLKNDMEQISMQGRYGKGKY